MSLFPYAINITRKTVEIVNGLVKESQPVSFVIQGTIQPLSGKDMAFLPTGRRDQGAIKIYTLAELNTSEEGSGDVGDYIVWQGRKWEVVTKLPFQSGIIPHNKYIALISGVESDC